MMVFGMGLIRRCAVGEFKSCPVCQEQSDQCLSCASYVVDGERIYYEKLKDFGAVQDHEVRFINRIKKHSVIAFFHNGKLHIPSRQGRSVPLAIGLQWDAWQEQQSKIEQLEKEKSLQELEINQISQANQEWQRLNLKKGKRIAKALQMLKDWDDQTYRDDIDQLVGELTDTLRGECE